MKLYVLYEQTCDGESKHRYFINRSEAEYALYYEGHDFKYSKSKWLIEVETED